MKIVNLSVSNVLAIKAVSIAPSSDVVTLGGRNGSGKSSVLNAIAMALGGSKLVPEVPIHKGADRGTIQVDLGDYVVERVFTQGGERLTVTSKDGAKYPKPQSLLDKLYASTAFDPLQFAMERDHTKQSAMLRQLLGLDFSDLDTAKKAASEERAQVNRDLKAAQAMLQAMPAHDPNAPASPVSVADIAAELTAANNEAKRQQQLKEQAAQVAKAAETARERMENEEDSIRMLEAQLEAARVRLESAKAALQTANERAAKAKVIIEALVPPDTAEVMVRLSSVEGVNRAVELNAKRAESESKVEKLRAESEALTAKLDGIESDRASRIAGAQFPVAGLGFSDSGVTYEGLPFSQASTAAKLRVSVAVAIAMNPKLRVFLVRDGSLLDPDSLELLHGLAKEHDCQLWVEDARTQDPAAIMIEDGTIAVANAAE